MASASWPPFTIPTASASTRKTQQCLSWTPSAFLVTRECRTPCVRLTPLTPPRSNNEIRSIPIARTPTMTPSAVPSASSAATVSISRVPTPTTSPFPTLTAGPSLAPFQVTTLAGSYGPSGTNNAVGSFATFTNPYGCSVDVTGSTVFVADTNNNLIRAVDVGTRIVSTLAGGGAAGADGFGSVAGFRQPYGVASHPNGKTLYVADTVDHSIRAIALPSALVTTIAGLSGSANFINGIGSAARFNNPSALVVDPAGSTLYVTDTS